MAAVAFEAWEEMRGMLDVDSLSADEIAALSADEISALPSEVRDRLIDRYKRLLDRLEAEVDSVEASNRRDRTLIEDLRSAQRAIRDESFLNAQIRLQEVTRKNQLLMMEAANTPSAPIAADPLANLPTQARQPWWGHIDAFFTDKPQTEDNRANYMREFERMAEVLDREKPLALVSRNDLDAYHDHLLRIAKPRKGNGVLSHAAQGRCLSHIKSFFTWALEREWISKDPAAGLAPKGLTKRQISKKKRRPFTVSELKTLFSAPLFTGCQGPSRLKEAGDYLYRGGKYWLPLLALWTGGRLTELTDLRVSDIQQCENVWYASVAIIPDTDEGDEEEKTAKTEHARRLAPLHTDFLALGFLDFVAYRRDLGGSAALLFDEVADYGPVFNRDEMDGDRRVTGIFAALGIKHVDTSFHSLRHSYADMLRDSRLDHRLQDRLMGHAPSGAAKHYGSPLTAGEMEQFSAVRVQVSLSHLLPLHGRPHVPTGALPEARSKKGRRAGNHKIKLVPGKLREGRQVPQAKKV